MPGRAYRSPPRLFPGHRMFARPTVGRSAGRRRYPSRPVSTRLLIIAALLCGLAILVAFTVQVLLAGEQRANWRAVRPHRDGRTANEP